MTPNNFNWFLHSLLFFHTEQVIKTQRDKAAKQQDEINESEEEDEEITDDGEVQL